MDDTMDAVYEVVVTDLSDGIEWEPLIDDWISGIFASERLRNQLVVGDRLKVWPGVLSPCPMAIDVLRDGKWVRVK